MYLIGSKTCCIPKVGKFESRKRISTLTGLKVPSLACKPVFYTNYDIMQKENSMELNLEGLEMQKWNIPTDRIQRSGKKNRVIHLFEMFTLWVSH